MSMLSPTFLVKEKSVSGMMVVVHRRDTDAEVREERISQLKKVIRSHAWLFNLCLLTLC